MARMRTLPEAIRHIKEIDPGTSLTQHALRVLVLSGEFPHIKIGAKRLVDTDLLERFLSGDYVPPKVVTGTLGVIRQLPEKIAK